MASLTKGVSYSSPGLPTRQVSITRTGEAIASWGGADAPVTLNAAKQMTDYAEGAANVVTGNLTAGHGQTSGTYAFYWQESGVNKCRYGVPVTVTVNAIETTNVGAGNDFPTTPDAQPVLCKQKTVTASIDGDAVSILVATLDFGNTAATGRGNVACQESDGTAVGAIAISGIVSGVATVDLDITGGASNVITGNAIAKVQVTHNDISYTPTFELVVLTADTTP